ncbi:MAG: 3-oxoacyl-ACP reductase FabG [Clostridia bacterium]|nr:3-oxoacyl-ACP reductase FabG [Clostridia bacterium]
MSKTVIVTGASKGIGAATAILFAEKGYNVVINYNNSFKSAELLATSLSSRGLSVFPFKADVSNILECELIVKETIHKFGSVDILVNNAGVSFSGIINELSDYDKEKMFDVNLNGCYNMCKAVTNQMVNQKHGKIVNVTSIWGETGASCEVAYSASKAGVIGLTKALAKELAPSNINVNAVSPGIIDTSMNAHLSNEELDGFLEEVPLGRIGKTEDVAEAIYFLSTEKSDYITGQILGVNGGYLI